MAVWTQPRFLEQAGGVGRSAFVDAHQAFLNALDRAGAVPVFDGGGEKQATYKVRVAPDQNWHILRVNANGEVILMLNHLRESDSPSTATDAERLFDKHLRSTTREAPRLAHNPIEFILMDFDGVAQAVRHVADIVRS